MCVLFIILYTLPIFTFNARIFSMKWIVLTPRCPTVPYFPKCLSRLMILNFSTTQSIALSFSDIPNMCCICLNSNSLLFTTLAVWTAPFLSRHNAVSVLLLTKKRKEEGLESLEIGTNDCGLIHIFSHRNVNYHLALWNYLFTPFDFAGWQNNATVLQTIHCINVSVRSVKSCNIS